MLLSHRTGGTFVNILAGSQTLSGQEVTTIEATVRKIYQHPGFNALTGENNIAVMELDTPIPESSAQPTCLEYHALGTIDLSDYQDCFISGWGTLRSKCDRFHGKKDTKDTLDPNHVIKCMVE